MKHITKIEAVSVLLLLVLGACNRDPFVGRWQRIGDEFAGTVVSVQQNGNTYSARLVEVPEPLKARGFKTGEIKWRNLTVVSDSEDARTFKGEDLGKNLPKTGQPSQQYAAFVLDVKADTAWGRVTQNELDVVGTAQIWTKMK